MSPRYAIEPFGDAGIGKTRCIERPGLFGRAIQGSKESTRRWHGQRRQRLLWSWLPGRISKARYELITDGAVFYQLLHFYHFLVGDLNDLLGYLFGFKFWRDLVK